MARRMYGVLKSNSWWHECKRSKAFRILGQEIQRCPICKLEQKTVREYWNKLRNTEKKKDEK